MVEGRCTSLMLLFMVMFADKLLITANWSTVSNRDGQDVALAKGDAWAEPRWQPYKKHLPPSSRTKKWSQLVRETGQGRNPAFYHQDLLGQIEELEMTCRREGHVLGERGPIRSYWLEFGHVIGASRGEETRFLFVEHHQDGSVHGHPVTWEELKKKGARDEDRQVQ